ncbi:MAG: hypothetical protein ABJ004_08025 [Cyclobacteriaceae bacterium]
MIIKIKKKPEMTFIPKYCCHSGGCLKESHAWMTLLRFAYNDGIWCVKNKPLSGLRNLKGLAVPPARKLGIYRINLQSLYQEAQRLWKSPMHSHSLQVSVGRTAPTHHGVTSRD